MKFFRKKAQESVAERHYVLSDGKYPEPEPGKDVA